MTWNAGEEWEATTWLAAQSGGLAFYNCNTSERAAPDTLFSRLPLLDAVKLYYMVNVRIALSTID